jgi:hypothetical protein
MLWETGTYLLNKVEKKEECSAQRPLGFQPWRHYILRGTGES